MKPIIQFKIARVVQFTEPKYDKDGIFLLFLADMTRPVIVVENVAIDIYTYQVFEILPKVHGNISVETLQSIDQNQLYVYQLYEASIPKECEMVILKQALGAYEWYHGDREEKARANVPSFEKAKQKIFSKKPRKKEENQKK